MRGRPLADVSVIGRSLTNISIQKQNIRVMLVLKKVNNILINVCNNNKLTRPCMYLYNYR